MATYNPNVTSYNLSDVDWFEWNGVKCTDWGMHVLVQPDHIAPTETLSSTTIPGRSGSLTISEGTDIFSDLSMSVTCIVDIPYREDNLNLAYISHLGEKLRGRASIRFANRREGIYYGRLSNQLSLAALVRGDPHRSFTLQFACEPFLYLDEGFTPITITSENSPMSVTNTGNITAQPLLKVKGAGEGTIMIGDQTILLSDISDIDYILIDCEAKIAYKGAKGDPNDPLTLLNTRVSGEWMKIPTGLSYVTLSGDITSVELTPRWRMI